jgi:hypothetical protein
VSGQSGQPGRAIIPRFVSARRATPSSPSTMKSTIHVLADVTGYIR